MNRTVLIGGGAAVVALLGGAAWFLIGGGAGTSPSGQTGLEDQGPIALNPVAVITDHSAAQSDDGRMLSVTFPKFELVAKGSETTSAVFSTTWRIKLAPQDRATVATVSLSGFMKSVGTPPPAPPPAPAAQPQPAPVPATEGTAPAPAGDATPPVEQPAAAPAPAAPAKPVAGDGTARVIVTIGGETSVTEWRDWTGTGSDHQLSKAVAYIGTSADMRNGATVPVTVTVEVAGGTSTETLSRLNSLELRLFAEAAPLPTEPPSSPGTAPGAPADATPPADASTTPAPATTPTP